MPKGPMAEQTGNAALKRRASGTTAVRGGMDGGESKLRLTQAQRPGRQKGRVEGARAHGHGATNRQKPVQQSHDPHFNHRHAFLLA